MTLPKIPALPYIRAGISEGLSANTAFRRYQDAAREQSDETGLRWTASNRSTFLQQYSALRVAREQIADALTAPKDLPFGGLTPVRRESTRSGAYLYTGAAFTRIPGTSDVERTLHMIRTREALTPQEVEDRIREQVIESSVEHHGTFAGYTLEAVTFTGVEELVPEGEG